MVMAPDGTQTQERLCWLGPAANYQTGLERSPLWYIRQSVRSLAEDILKIRYQEVTSKDRGLYTCCSYSDLKSV
jgi:hypothetical protein